MAMAGRLALRCSLVLAAATAFSVQPSPTRFAVASTTARAARRHFGRALPRTEAEADVTIGDGRGRERRSVDRAGALDVAFEASDAACTSRIRRTSGVKREGASTADGAAS